MVDAGNEEFPPFVSVVDVVVLLLDFGFWSWGVAGVVVLPLPAFGVWSWVVAGVVVPLPDFGV